MNGCPHKQNENRRSIEPVSNSTDCDVLIVGAGPYGLSAYAHLRGAGINTKVFGEPMEFWDKKMPTGMLLRSPREASTISDPDSRFTLEAFEAATGTKPVKRVPRETFVNYGKWFEGQLGSDVDRRSVAKLSPNGSGFEVVLADGTKLKSKRVVIAAGVGPFKKSPAWLSELPAERVSHCYEGRDLLSLGKRVAVIGAGQSALECAALLCSQSNSRACNVWAPRCDCGWSAFPPSSSGLTASDLKKILKVARFSSGLLLFIFRGGTLAKISVRGRSSWLSHP